MVWLSEKIPMKNNMRLISWYWLNEAAIHYDLLEYWEFERFRKKVCIGLFILAKSYHIKYWKPKICWNGAAIINRPNRMNWLRLWFWPINILEMQTNKSKKFYYKRPKTRFLVINWNWLERYWNWQIQSKVNGLSSNFDRTRKPSTGKILWSNHLERTPARCSCTVSNVILLHMHNFWMNLNVTFVFIMIIVMTIVNYNRNDNRNDNRKWLSHWK